MLSNSIQFELEISLAKLIRTLFILSDYREVSTSGFRAALGDGQGFPLHLTVVWEFCHHLSNKRTCQ